ncbi:CBS domain-containing protein [Desulfolutivibrio sulfoxidireducens]|uniref:CBS domain-containing protein n=1 Tax=Desulfolutivibrio sulfoxidireducens TaxID=2773299 RepID=UPI00159E8E03|nr:CBS domain-containing protein [Desulfolutivibrio sulfoxidireducens]QLA15530.1 CBS domain-containing protein [Desulfolutivibrio sulfoxidireducens]QLA19128.1 CBS domain-containing protein [Desulfolutivibrio sulfoxidireducens]
MLKAKDVMSREVLTVSPDTEISQAARMLLDKGFNGLPVTDPQGRLVGILCQSDLVAQQKKISLPSVFSLLDGFVPLSSMKDLDREMDKITALTVAAAMTPHPACVSPETGVDEVATLMTERNFHTLPVVEAGKLVGIIGMRDILRALAK